MRRLKTFLALCFLLLPFTVKADIKQYVLPQKVNGVKTAVINLNGQWEFRFSPKGKWEKVSVPGELVMQGYGIKHDVPYLYKKDVFVPADFKYKRTVLRFDGVYSYARLWVNGVYVRDHTGGFTRWESDITHFVKPGKKNEIRLEVTDCIDDISYASGYAHHPIGGILRDVTLYALPKVSLANLSVETALDSLYRDAKLNISYQLTAEEKDINKTNVAFYLESPNGSRMKLSKQNPTFKDGVYTYSYVVKEPLKWDAEHPHLYTLHLNIRKGNRTIYQTKQSVGFRKIEIKGRVMLVNGKPIKLRGACRHDVHPTLGRVATEKYDSLDAVLFKKANMNFVRTSHYPPSEKFIEYCNKLGLFVESETAICFVDSHRQKNYRIENMQNDPKYTDQYMSQLKEMLYSFRSHPSILFWSIGNESAYGTNFQLSYDFMKKNDKTRPVIFSYPGTVKDGAKVYDILSFHYPGVEGTLSQYGMSSTRFESGNKPAIFDEWAHVPCYTYETLRRDPSIRSFWGESLDKMWSNLFVKPGGLGGAIWGYSDETFMIPELKKGNAFWLDFAKTRENKFQGKCVGYGEWGIVDVWRREKPEFWSTKKAYSPVRLLQTEIECYRSNSSLLVPIYNRFDHTFLNEITATYTYQGKTKNVKLPNIAPHNKGILEIPAHAWKQNDVIHVAFYGLSGELIDAYNLKIDPRYEIESQPTVAKKLRIEKNTKQIIVQGDHFKIPFDKQTGLISKATRNGKVIIEKGPFLNLDLSYTHFTKSSLRKKGNGFRVDTKDWKKESLKVTKLSDYVQVTIKGTYKAINLTTSLRIYPSGEISIYYKTNAEPAGIVKEAGLAFELPTNVETLDWQRKGYFSFYPADCYDATEGHISLYNKHNVAYRIDPKQSWKEDTHNYFYFGDKGATVKLPFTNQARGLKEHIYAYTLTTTEDVSLKVLSPKAKLGCRIYKTPQQKIILHVNNRWDYPAIGWGNYSRQIEVQPNQGAMILKL